MKKVILRLFFTAEGAMKARREIADYLKNKRTERARIRVSLMELYLELFLVPIVWSHV